MALYNRYEDLTPMQRYRQASEAYLRLSSRNISEQSRLNEERAKEPEYSALSIKEGGPDVSEELKIIDDNFRFLNVNILKLKSFVDRISKSGAKKKSKLVAPVAPIPPDPDDAIYQADLDPDNNGVNDPEYIKADNIYLRELNNYNAEVLVYNQKMLNLIDTIPVGNINVYVDNITKCLYNIESINSNTKDIVKIILDNGEENFNFSQLNNTYKLYNKFFKEYTSFLNFFYPGGVSIFEEALRYAGVGTKNLDIMNEYTIEFNNLCQQVIALYEGLKMVSQEKGIHKIKESSYSNSEPFVRNPNTRTVVVNPPAQRQYGATSTVKGSGRSQRLYHWAWM